MNSTLPKATEAPARRKLLGAAFWFVFISTPAALIAMRALFKQFPPLNLLGGDGLFEASSTLFSGSIIAAFLLARLHSKTTAQLIVRTLGFGLTLVLLFGVLSYAGCVLIK